MAGDSPNRGFQGCSRGFIETAASSSSRPLASYLSVDNLDASVYARICDSDRLVDTLARITARSYRGRQYLGHVSFELGLLGSEFAGRHRTALKLAANTDRDDSCFPL